MEEKNELSAKEALMTQMGILHEQLTDLLSKEDLSEDELKRAKLLNGMFVDCYDRMAKDDSRIDEMNFKYIQHDHDVEQKNKELEAEAERAVEDARKAKRDMKIDIAKVVITGVIIPVGIAIISGRHADKIALAESVGIIGTKEAFRQTENAFKDSLKNVGKII